MYAKTWELDDCLPHLRPKFVSAKYRTAIDVLNKHLSGILIIKTLEDSSTRVVFINEVGATFFDMTYNENTYAFNSIMKSLDKKAVKKTLAKDIGMILMRGIYKDSPMVSSDSVYRWITFKLHAKGSVRYKTDYECNPVNLIENFGKSKTVVSVQQFYQEQNLIPDSIFVQHHTVHFNISLKQLHVTE
jgi:hypothetical protein